MKPDHARALANSALPTLADASSIAAVAPNDLSLATELLNVQLKLHLLTTEHLVLSHGFLYDNPAIWETLNKDIVEHLASVRRDGTSTLLLQINAAAVQDSQASPDVAFRTWAFGEDQARHLEPSALRVIGRDKSDAALIIRNLNHSSSTLEDYAEALKLRNLTAAATQIKELVSTCTILPKPENRYEIFRDHVEQFLDFLAHAQLRGIIGPLQDLYDCIQPLRSYLSKEGRISRSGLEAFDSALWWRLAPYLNQYRLRGYLPLDRPGFMSYFPSPASEAISELMQKEDSGIKQGDAKWLVALDHLSFEDIFRIRDLPAFRNVLEELGDVWIQQQSPDVYERYCAVLGGKWRTELAEAVSRIAPHCVVDKDKKEGKWIPPVSAAAGCAAGATTLAVYGSVAFPYLSLDVSGVGAATYLLLLGAKRIADSFRVDKPELAAHLVASKVIGSVPAMAIEERIGSTN